MRMKLTLALAALGGALAFASPSMAAPLGSAAPAAVDKAQAGNGVVEQVHKRRYWRGYRYARRHHYRPYRYARPYYYQPYYYSYPYYGYYRPYYGYGYGYRYYRRPGVSVYFSF